MQKLLKIHIAQNYLLIDTIKSSFGLGGERNGAIKTLQLALSIATNKRTQIRVKNTITKGKMEKVLKQK